MFNPFSIVHQENKDKKETKENSKINDKKYESQINYNLDNKRKIVNINKQYDVINFNENKYSEKSNLININNPKSNNNINLNDINYTNQIKKEDNDNDICKNCKNIFVECSICEGLFEIEFFYLKHESFCKNLYDFYKQKEDLVDCSECKCIIKFSDFIKHKEICLGFNHNIKTETLKCYHCNRIFPLDMIEQHEVSCLKEVNENILLEEKIKCNYCNENVSFSYLEIHEMTCLKLKENNEIIDKGLKSCVEYPSNWSASDDFVIKLSNIEDDYQMVMKLVTNSSKNIKILDISRIQNKHLWQRFYKERLKILKEKGECREEFLFHGSKDISHQIISNEGFDISYSKEGEQYGRGIYFYKLASTANNYAYREPSKNYIFLANVLIGLTKESEVNVSLRKPPFYNSENFIYYDSISNKKKGSSNNLVDEIYVVYNNEKAYPSYLIEYQLK